MPARTAELVLATVVVPAALVAVGGVVDDCGGDGARYGRGDGHDVALLLTLPSRIGGRLVPACLLDWNWSGGLAVPLAVVAGRGCVRRGWDRQGWGCGRTT